MPSEKRLKLVSKIQEQLSSFVPYVKYLSHTNVNLTDLNAEFQQNHDCSHTDGLHPSENEIKAIVKSLRNNLINLNVEISDCVISIRTKQNRQKTRPSQKDVSPFLRNFMVTDVIFGQGLSFISNMLDALVLYHKNNAKMIFLKCSVTGYLEQTQVDSGKIYCNYFFAMW